MATSFPTSIDSFTTKTDNVDTISAAHINNLQDAMIATETILGASSSRATAWTPSVRFSGGSTGMTYTASGYYARFGSLIFVQGSVLFSAKGTSTGDLQITNAPVAALNQASLNCYYVFQTSMTWTTSWPLNGRINGTTIDFYSYAAGSGFTRLTDANVANTSTIGFSGLYFHA